MGPGNGGRRHNPALPALLLLLVLLVGGCVPPVHKSDKVLPDWSRGLVIGTSAINDYVALAVEKGTVHLAWARPVDEKEALHYTRLGPQAQVLTDEDLPLETVHPAELRLLFLGEGTLLLAWRDRGRLFAASLSPTGQVISGPYLLSSPHLTATAYQLLKATSEAVELFWVGEKEGQGSLYHRRIGTSGKPLAENALLVEGAEEVTAQADQGQVHLAWTTPATFGRKEVHYGLFDPHTGELKERLKVSEFSLPTGAISYGPSLGLDESRLYIFWSVEQRGREAQVARAFYVSFPPGKPSFQEPVQIGIPSVGAPNYVPLHGDYNFHRLAPHPGGIEVPVSVAETDFLNMPAPVPGRRRQLAVMFQLKAYTRVRQRIQVALALFSRGRLLGYQLVTRSDSVSLRPLALADEGGDLHLVWIDPAGFGRYDVYYASTAESVKAAIDPLTPQEVMAGIIEAAWRSISALAWFPLLFIWSIVPLVWLALFSVTKATGDLRERNVQVALGIALALYLGSKLVMIPGFLFYAPFLEQLPEALAPVGLLIWPLFTTALGTGAVLLYARRTLRPNIFAAYLLFTLADGTASLMLYIPRAIGK